MSLFAAWAITSVIGAMTVRSYFQCLSIERDLQVLKERGDAILARMLAELEKRAERDDEGEEWKRR